MSGWMDGWLGGWIKARLGYCVFFVIYKCYSRAKCLEVMFL